MAQTIVPKFYSTRKRFKEPGKSLKNEEKSKLSEILDVAEPAKKILVDVPKREKKTVVEEPILEKKTIDDKPKLEKKTVVDEQKVEKKTKDVPKSKKKTTVDAKKAASKSSKTKPKSKKENKITNYLKSTPEISKTQVNVDVPNSEIPRTPKRHLTPEELTPSKKKSVIPSEASTSQEASPTKFQSPSKSVNLTPRKQNSVACKKLLLNSPNRFGSPKKFASPVKKDLTPQKEAAYENLTSKNLASLVNDSRSKILFSSRLDDLKKSLEAFSNVSSKSKEYQANAFKITSVISSVKSSDKEPTATIQKEPAYKKFSYLAAPKAESTLVLPYKYKLLGETFRCLDTVVQIINNRKEKVTFEKVKCGVQDMMKKSEKLSTPGVEHLPQKIFVYKTLLICTKVAKQRNFLMNHLGQIMSVFPEAYFLEYEKYDSYKRNSAPHQLIITPNLTEINGNVPETTSKGSKSNEKGFLYMSPQHLLQRRHIFEQNLMKLTKQHHQEFLQTKHFPPVPDDRIVRWHPSFSVDSVPNIPVAALPEEPDVKVCTAKDVLNRIKGSFRGKVEKALQSVVDERESKESSCSESDAKKNEKNIIISKERSTSVADPKKKQNSALKGICTDLLEKIRAREAAKLIETMTRSPQDEKRLAMLERVPKIVHILWHFFIAERKAAVPVDIAVEKIIHSFNSLMTPDVVKEHLELIRETIPGWLSVIKIPKGEYLTIDKKRDINEMLANIKK